MIHRYQKNHQNPQRNGELRIKPQCSWIEFVKVLGLEVSVFCMVELGSSTECGLQYKPTFGFEWEREFNK